MPKYRLTWRGTGALDLSQVLDERGVPVLFTKPGDSVVVDGGTFQHPLVKRYVRGGVVAEEVDIKATTGLPPPHAPPPPPAKAKAAPPAEPTPKKVEVKAKAIVKEALTVETTATDEDSKPADPLAEETARETTTTPFSKPKKGKRGGRSNK